METTIIQLKSLLTTLRNKSGDNDNSQDIIAVENAIKYLENMVQIKNLNNAITILLK
jgi:hypothetical protein